MRFYRFWELRCARALLPALLTRHSDERDLLASALPPACAPQAAVAWSSRACDPPPHLEVASLVSFICSTAGPPAPPRSQSPSTARPSLALVGGWAVDGRLVGGVGRVLRRASRPLVPRPVACGLRRVQLAKCADAFPACRQCYPKRQHRRRDAVIFKGGSVGWSPPLHSIADSPLRACMPAGGTTVCATRSG